MKQPAFSSWAALSPSTFAEPSGPGAHARDFDDSGFERVLVPVQPRRHRRPSHAPCGEPPAEERSAQRWQLYFPERLPVALRVRYRQQSGLSGDSLAQWFGATTGERCRQPHFTNARRNWNRGKVKAGGPLCKREGGFTGKIIKVAVYLESYIVRIHEGC